jgi:hypothetical protein
MSEKPVDDEFIVDEVTGEISLKEPKKYRTLERHGKTRKSPSVPPPSRKGRVGKKKTLKNMGKPRKLEALLNVENTPEKIEQAGYLIKKGPSEIAHKAAMLGLDNAEKVYGAIISIAMDESVTPEVRGPFLKFVADRTIGRRVTKLLPLPTVPKVKTLDDIELAMQEIIRLMVVGEITYDECESLSRSYANLSSIIESKQVALVQRRLLQMQESLIKTVNKEVLLTEIDERLMDYEQEDRLDKFQAWFHDYLSTDRILEMLAKNIQSQDDKLKVLREISRICK